MSTPLYSEKKLAETLGLDREDLSHARKTLLKKAEDYRQMPGRQTAIAASGIAKLREAGFTIADQALLDSQLEDRNGDDPLAPVRLVVTQIFPNRNLIQARFDVTPQDARRVQVWVKDNKNFLRNVALTARPRAPGSLSYELVGQCPRRKGWQR